MALTGRQLYSLARMAGLDHSSAVVAAAIALAESSGRPEAVGDGGSSFGLWQIHLPAHPQYRGADLTNPMMNAYAMAQISAGGTNFKPWTTYRTGAYRRFIPQVLAEVGAGPVAIPQLGGAMGTAQQTRLPKLPSPPGSLPNPEAGTFSAVGQPEQRPPSGRFVRR